MVEPIDPFLPETGGSRQIDPAHGFQPAQTTDERVIGCRTIEEERRAYLLAKFSIGNPAADGVLKCAFERLAREGGLRFDRRAQTYAENFFQEQAAN